MPDIMDPLLLVLASLILLHAGLFLVGLAHLNMLSRQVPSVVAAALLISGVTMSMTLMRWDFLILSFVLYQAWTMLESLFLQGKIKQSSLALAPVNLITIVGSMVSFFSGLWVIFGATYFFHWTLTLFIGKRMVSRN